MNDKLKPCPFCAGEIRSKLYGYGVPGVITCDNCKTMFIIPWDEAEGGNELLNAWNERANRKIPEDAVGLTNEEMIEEMTRDYKLCGPCEMCQGYIDEDGKPAGDWGCIEGGDPTKCGICVRAAKLLINAGYIKRR